MNLSAKDVLVREWKVKHDLREDCQLALFDENKSELVVLNAGAAAIWESLDGVATIEDVAMRVSSGALDAPSLSDVLPGVLSLLESLAHRGAVRLRTA